MRHRYPVLLAVAHGSRNPQCPSTVDGLLRRVAELRPELPVRAGYVELSTPLLPEALDGLAGRAAVVVPLLLGAGYHTRMDIRGRVPAGLPVAPALGPHPLLVRALLGRLAEAGWQPGEPVVLAGAGSAEPESVAAAHATGQLLAVAAGSPVLPAFVATARPGVPATVTALRARYPGRRIAVASYLLAPGRFADAVAAAPADLIGAPLGDHDAVARLVLRRYDEARAGGVLPRPDRVSGILG